VSPSKRGKGAGSSAPFTLELRGAKFYFFFLLGACVKADAATLLALLVVFGSESNMPAFEATLLDVFSPQGFLVAMMPPCKLDAKILDECQSTWPP
jgi:hypothetical protein